MSGFKSRRTAILITAFILIAASAAIYIAYMRELSTTKQVTLYYYNTSTGCWETESYAAKNTQSTLDTASGAVERLRRLTDQPPYKAFPRNISADLSLDGETINVRLPSEYEELLASEKNIAVASIVYTLTGLNYVNSVRLYAGENELLSAGGTAYGLLSRDKLVINSEFLPNNIGIRTVKLHFADAALSKLVSVERTIELQPNKPLVSHVMEELIAGPDTKDYARLIPADAKLRDSVKIDGNICYVDFTSDFLARIDNQDTLVLTVSSIVNTLLDNSNAILVQLLFAGDKTAASHESLDPSKPLSRFAAKD